MTIQHGTIWELNVVNRDVKKNINKNIIYQIDYNNICDNIDYIIILKYL